MCKTMDSDDEDVSVVRGSFIQIHSRSRLYELFGLIEKEFEVLFAENIACKLIFIKKLFKGM